MAISFKRLCTRFRRVKLATPVVVNRVEVGVFHIEYGTTRYQAAGISGSQISCGGRISSNPPVRPEPRVIEPGRVDSPCQPRAFLSFVSPTRRRFFHRLAVRCSNRARQVSDGGAGLAVARSKQSRWLHRGIYIWTRLSAIRRRQAKSSEIVCRHLPRARTRDLLLYCGVCPATCPLTLAEPGTVSATTRLGSATAG
jgi:hypothetical protein